MAASVRAGVYRTGSRMIALLAVLFLGFPAVAIYGARRSKILDFLSPVVLCYLFGILLGNIGVVPPDSAASDFADVVTSAMVVLAIPLLLFGTDFRRWLRIARPTVVSFGLAVVAIAVTATVASFVFSGVGEDSAKVAGMTVGVYTGGTANMAAIGKAVGVEDATFVALNAADVMISSVYLLFLMSAAQRILLKFLPPFSFTEPGSADPDQADPDEAEELHEHDDPWEYKPPPKDVGRGLLASLGVVVLAGAVGFAIVSLVSSNGSEPILDSDAFVTAVILGITTLGIAASFVRRIHEIPGTYEVGQYLFLVFACAIGTLANLAELAESFTTVFPFIATALVGAILLHYVLAAIFRIDADTAIITSTAAVFGPPFIGPIAAVLKNREIVVSGLTTGVVGLAVGNYAGLAVAWALGG